MFIKRSDIEYRIPVSRRKSSDIFKEYVEKLTQQGKTQLMPNLLPKDWFVKEFAKDKGLPVDDLMVRFKTKGGIENDE